MDNNIFFDFLNELSTFKNVDCTKFESFDNSFFLSLSNIYFTLISDDNINLYKSSYNGNSILNLKKIFEINSVTSVYLSTGYNSFFNNDVILNISSINNLYISEDIKKNIKLINNTIIIVEDNLSTCIFSIVDNFNDILPYINNINGGSLKYSSISSITFSSNLNSFNFGPNQFASIGFYKSLLSVDISNISNLSSIPESFFEENYNLRNVILPTNIKKIKKLSFSKCLNLKKIIIPDSVVTIEDYAFTNCKNLEYIEIGKNVNEIGEYSFFGDNNIKIIIVKNKDKIINLHIDNLDINFDLKIFVCDNLYDEYINYVNNNYLDNNIKYFFYKMSEMQTYKSEIDIYT